MSYQSAKDWQDSQPGTQTMHEKAQHTPDGYAYFRVDGVLYRTMGLDRSVEAQNGDKWDRTRTLSVILEAREIWADREKEITSIPSLLAQVAELTAQRDALLEALREIDGNLHGDLPITHEIKEICKRVGAQATGNGQ